jgi:hypothetical protein
MPLQNSISGLRVFFHPESWIQQKEDKTGCITSLADTNFIRIVRTGTKNCYLALRKYGLDPGFGKTYPGSGDQKSTRTRIQNTDSRIEDPVSIYFRSGERVRSITRVKDLKHRYFPTSPNTSGQILFDLLQKSQVHYRNFIYVLLKFFVNIFAIKLIFLLKFDISLSGFF